MVATRGLPPEIIDLENFTESMNWLVYGHTGVGKTVIAGQLPGRVLILATEKGTIAAKRQGSKAKVWTIRKWEDLAKAYEWLANNDHPFDWVVVDSITDMQYKCIRWIMRVVVSDNPKRDPHIPAPGDHFKWQLAMKEMITDFNELPVNVFWTAQEMIREDPDGEPVILPLIEGKDYQISSWVCATMDVVAHLDHKKVKAKGSEETRLVRILTCNESPPIFAKDRYDVLGRVVRGPNVAILMKKIADSETGRPDRTAVRMGTRQTATRKTAPPRRRVSA